MNGIGDKFQQETKYHPDTMPAGGLPRPVRPEPYKLYPQAPKVALPAFTPREQMSLDKALRLRKSTRDFKERPILLEQLSYLLWASTGIQRTEYGYQFRTAPSAGALYPIETYIIANSVQELPAGLYHYAIRQPHLEQIKLGDLSRQIAEAALGQEVCAAAPAVFVWSAVFNRCKYKYGQRAYRYIYMDAGHIAENLALAAVSLSLGTCQIGALFDDEVNKLIGLNGVQESTIYMTVVGVPA
jgi:SagB-type dehydrogenase family enzyme